MPKIALICGAILLLLGLAGYFGGAAAPPHHPQPAAEIDRGALPPGSPEADAQVQRASPTALVPSFVGILLMLCGTLGLEPRWRKHAMHGAAAVSVIGVLMGIGGLVRPMMLLAGGEEINPRAVFFVVAMGVVSAVFLVLAIRSFVAARRSAAAGSAD